MPVLCEFDTRSVHPWYKPTADARAILKFPCPFVAPPRLSYGFRRLDVTCNANIRVKSTLQDVTESYASCHITTWDDSTLYGAVCHVFALAPSDLEFLTGEHMRTCNDPSSVRVNFERPFVTPPKVVVFFNYINLDKSRTWRLSVTANNIDIKGFTLRIDAGGDIIFYATQACWIAYPEDRKHIFSTDFNTRDTRPAWLPQSTQSTEVTFDDVKFWEDPDVFVGLNHLDIECNVNLCVNAYVDGVSRTGLVLHIDSWGDTKLYAAGASIIAFD